MNHKTTTNTTNEVHNGSNKIKQLIKGAAELNNESSEQQATQPAQH